MKLRDRDEHLLRLLFLGIVWTLLYLTVLIPFGFLERGRLQSYDAYCLWRSALVSPPPQTQELLVVTIDEESQRQLGKKWPWDRGLFAEFLAKISQHQPKLVLLDFVLAGQSQPEHDEALARAIRAGPPVLLASYLDRNGDPVLPYSLFTEAGGIAGLINKPRDMDQTVRRLWAGIRIPMEPRILFAVEAKAAAIARGMPLDQLRLKQGDLWIGPDRIPLEPPGAMAINPFVRSEQVPTVSFWQVVKGEISSQEVRNRIVIVGSASEITHDVYPTSLGLMPGVMISANGILTLLSGKFSRPVPIPLALAAGLALVLSVLLATYRLAPLFALGLSLLLAGAAVAGGFALLLLFNFRADSLSILLLAGAAWLIGMSYRYFLLFLETFRLHRQVITDPVTGLHTARYFKLRLESQWTKLFRKRTGLVVIHLESPSALLQRLSAEEARARFRTVADALRRQAGRNDWVGHLAEDRLGLLLRGAALSQTQDRANRLQQALQEFPGHLAFGVAAVEQSASILSSADLILCAEAAASRARAQGNRRVESYNPGADSLLLGQRRETAPPEGSDRLQYVASELEQRNRNLEKALADLRQAHEELESHFLEVTKSLVMAMDTKDPYTAGHLERVSRYATRLGETLRLPAPEVEAIREAALLHDIGKMHLPDEILHKTGPLTPEEVTIIQQHLELGAKILDPMKFFKPITTLLYHHHERYDGKGYPHHLTGELIPSGAQVIAIADSFDAMTTNRGYNKPRTVQEALEELRRGAGTQFNPQYVEAFVRMMEREGPHLAGHQSPSA